LPALVGCGEQSRGGRLQVEGCILVDPIGSSNDLKFWKLAVGVQGLSWSAESRQVAVTTCAKHAEVLRV
jgi:hypothetical protein